jgi:hypothetical protein
MSELLSVQSKNCKLTNNTISGLKTAAGISASHLFTCLHGVFLKVSILIYVQFVTIYMVFIQLLEFRLPGYRFPKPIKLSLTGTFPSIGLLYLLLTVF